MLALVGAPDRVYWIFMFTVKSRFFFYIVYPIRPPTRTTRMYSENTFYSLLLTIVGILVACVLLFNLLDSPPVGTISPEQAAAMNRRNREAWERVISQNS